MTNGPECDLSKPWEEPAPRKLTEDFPSTAFDVGGVKGRAFRGLYAAGMFPPAGEFVAVTPEPEGLSTIWWRLMDMDVEHSKTCRVAIVREDQFDALLAALAAASARVVALPISHVEAYRNLLLDMLADLEEGSTDPTWPAKIRALLYPASEPQPQPGVSSQAGIPDKWEMVPDFECPECLGIFVEARGNDYRCTSCQKEWADDARGSQGASWADGMERAAELCDEEVHAAREMGVPMLGDHAAALASTIRAFKEEGADAASKRARPVVRIMLCDRCKHHPWGEVAPGDACVLEGCGGRYDVYDAGTATKVIEPASVARLPEAKP